MSKSTTKQKPVEAPKAPPTVKQQVSDLLSAYFATEDAILKTFLLDGEDEITIARETVWEQLDTVDFDEELEVEKVIDWLKDTSRDDHEAIVAKLEEEVLIEHMTDKLHKFDDVDLRNALSGSYHLIKTESIVQAQKLEDFLRTEIWPADNLYNENVLL